jgi:hypothetical protein
LRSTRFSLGTSFKEYSNGDSYEGELIGGLRNGFGSLSYANGSLYEGTFLQDKRDGDGTLVLPDGTRYTGTWQDDMQHGVGTLFFPSGDRFEGLFAQGRRQGQGTYFYPSRDAYSCRWVDDVMCNPLEFVFNNGDRLSEFTVNSDAKTCPPALFTTEGHPPVQVVPVRHRSGDVVLQAKATRALAISLIKTACEQATGILYAILFFGTFVIIMRTAVSEDPHDAVDLLSPAREPQAVIAVKSEPEAVQRSTSSALEPDEIEPDKPLVASNALIKVEPNQDDQKPAVPLLSTPLQVAEPTTARPSTQETVDRALPNAVPTALSSDITPAAPPLESWTDLDVASWLESLELGCYASLFAANKIKGPLLTLGLDDVTLSVIGISIPLHRRCILQAFQELVRGQEKPQHNTVEAPALPSTPGLPRSDS